MYVFSLLRHPVRLNPYCRNDRKNELWLLFCPVRILHCTFNFANVRHCFDLCICAKPNAHNNVWRVCMCAAKLLFRNHQVSTSIHNLWLRNLNFSNKLQLFVLTAGRHWTLFGCCIYAIIPHHVCFDYNMCQNIEKYPFLCLKQPSLQMSSIAFQLEKNHVHSNIIIESQTMR